MTLLLPEYNKISSCTAKNMHIAFVWSRPTEQTLKLVPILMKYINLTSNWYCSWCCRIENGKTTVITPQIIENSTVCSTAQTNFDESLTMRLFWISLFDAESLVQQSAHKLILRAKITRGIQEYIYDSSLTSSPINGATTPPMRAQHDAVPNPEFRITVGNTSVVWT